MTDNTKNVTSNTIDRPRDAIVSLDVFKGHGASAIDRGAIAGALRAHPDAERIINEAALAAQDKMMAELGMTSVTDSSLDKAARDRVFAAMAHMMVCFFKK